MSLGDLDLNLLRQHQERLAQLRDDLDRLDGIANQQAPAVLELLSQLQIIKRRINAMEKRISQLEGIE